MSIVVPWSASKQHLWSAIVDVKILEVMKSAVTSLHLGESELTGMPKT